MRYRGCPRYRSTGMIQTVWMLKSSSHFIYKDCIKPLHFALATSSTVPWYSGRSIPMRSIRRFGADFPFPRDAKKH